MRNRAKSGRVRPLQLKNRPCVHLRILILRHQCNDKSDGRHKDKEHKEENLGDDGGQARYGPDERPALPAIGYERSADGHETGHPKQEHGDGQECSYDVRPAFPSIKAGRAGINGKVQEKEENNLEAQNKREPNEEEGNKSIRHAENSQAESRPLHPFDGDGVSVLPARFAVVVIIIPAIPIRTAILEQDLLIARFVHVHPGTAEPHGTGRVTE